jgi:hypothetical protein
MGDIAEISLMNIKMMSSDKENKQDNNTNGVNDKWRQGDRHDNRRGFLQFN